jgi:DNA-binding response OmpR family regulator
VKESVFFEVVVEDTPAKTRERKPDILLLDVHLPKRTDFEVARCLLEMKLSKPVLKCSGIHI